MSSTPASQWIDRTVERALFQAFDKIESYRAEGYCTEEQVAQALGMGWDASVLDLWHQYTSEGG